MGKVLWLVKGLTVVPRDERALYFQKPDLWELGALEGRGCGQGSRKMSMALVALLVAIALIVVGTGVIQMFSDSEAKSHNLGVSKQVPRAHASVGSL